MNHRGSRWEEGRVVVGPSELAVDPRHMCLTERHGENTDKHRFHLKYSNPHPKKKKERRTENLQYTTKTMTLIRKRTTRALITVQTPEGIKPRRNCHESHPIQKNNQPTASTTKSSQEARQYASSILPKTHANPE